MTRLVVGPFNRVEGDLEVTLDVVDGRVREARVGAPLYRGFEQILIGRDPADAIVIAPRICGICSVSQSVAATAALRAAMGLTPAPAGIRAANLAHAAENVADHLTHFHLFFMPDFARAEYAGRAWFEPVVRRFRATVGEAGRAFLPARAGLMHVLGILAGKWPHSLAFQPGGMTRAIDLGEKMRLVGAVAGLRGFLEGPLLGSPLEEVAALDSAAALARWAEGRDSDFALFLRLAAGLGLDRLGPGPGLLMSHGAYHGAGSDGVAPLWPAGVFDSRTGTLAPLDADAVTETCAHAWLRAVSDRPGLADATPDPAKPGAYSWSKAPRLAGAPVEVGALARQVVAGHPLARDLVRHGASAVLARVVMRLVETARLALAMEGWVRELKPGEPVNRVARPPAEGEGVGLVEAARGALGHYLRVQGGRITHYQIIAPTTWNFSPRDEAGVPGPLEGALAGLELGGLGARAAVVQHVVRSFDPCMVCTAH